MSEPRNLQDEIRRRLEQTQRASERTSAGAGQTALQRGSISEARSRGGAPRPNLGAGLVPGIRTAELPAGNLTPEERASLQRQTQPRPQAPPQTAVRGGLAPGLRTTEVRPTDLTPSEYRSLQRQAGTQAVRPNIAAGLERPEPIRPRGVPSPERVAFEQQRAAQAATSQAPQAPPATQGSPVAPEKPGMVKRGASAAGRLGGSLLKGGAAGAAMLEGISQAERALAGESTPTTDLPLQWLGDATGFGVIGNLLESAGERFGAQGMSDAGTFARDLGRRAVGVPAEAVANVASSIAGLGRNIIDSIGVGDARRQPSQEPIIIDPRDANPARPPSIADGMPDADIDNPMNSVRAGRQQQVLGTFTGGDGVTRTIDEGEAQRLAGQIQVAGDPDNGGAFVRPWTGPAAQVGGFHAMSGRPRDIVAARVRDIQDPRSAAGQLYARLSRDQTPTGKRLAAQFLSEYLGAGNEEQRNQTALQVSANQVGAQMAEQELRTAQQIAAAEAAARRPSVRIGPQGQVLSIADGLATQLPVIDAQTGRPVAQSRGGLTDAQRATEIRRRLESGLVDDEQEAKRLRAIYNQLIGVDGG